MPLFLCLDGGGTKTTAVIAATDPFTGSPYYVRGEAGPSNLTNCGAEGCIAALTLATSLALSSLPPGVYDTSQTVVSGAAGSTWDAPFPGRMFKNVWAGLSGCARPTDYALMSPLLSTLFPGAEIRLTNDGELLTAPIYSTTHLDLITLIVGTGSLGLKWDRQEPAHQVVQVGRSGGWGFLLGDEGSGWSLGREGIKSVLSQHANHRPLLPWHHEILDLFGVDHNPHMLLARLTTLDTSRSHQSADVERKKKIAACTKQVVQAGLAGDEEAKRIMGKVAREVVDVVRPLVEMHGKTGQGGDGRGDRAGLGGTMLVVGGGLGGVKEFWEMVQEGMEGEGWKWAASVHLSDAAGEGAKVLLQSDGM